MGTPASSLHSRIVLGVALAICTGANAGRAEVLYATYDPNNPANTFPIRFIADSILGVRNVFGSNSRRFNPGS